MDGVAAAYVDKQIKIHLAEDKALDEEAVKAKLKEFKIATKEITKSDKVPF
ncbi:hypothetical protein SAMN02745181_3026 [Rubritalea squalenifaciens DSM 18772]|uniref:Uncharacterized protein n=2 Tax=Rubritalea TaxID=361050 RepID=A0A1M6NZG0_9BACT|nr:hypothetical protein [Rubritalea squalenifaciens]SHK01073.1 hypothetical protein SAMN02745181_3026 [Rubritalea squalenifaciens DSM 18772]